MFKNIFYIVLVGIIFIYVYNPPLFFLPMNSGIMVGIFFLLLHLTQMTTQILLRKPIAINRAVLKIVLTAGLLVTYALFIAIVTLSFDFQVFKSYLSFILFYIPGAFGIVSWAKKKFTSIEIIKIFIVVNVVQSVIILVMLVSPAVKTFLFSLLRDGDVRIEKNLMMGGFRFLGFAFNSTWDLSIVQSLGLMYIALLMKLNRREISIKNILFFLLIASSIFLTGRTGFIGLLFALLILVIPADMREVPLLKLSRFLIKLTVVSIPLVIFVIAILPGEVTDIVEKNVVPWAFELFQNENGGKLETESSNELKTMYFMPEAKTLIFGDGYYVSPFDSTRYYMDTDAGYMRHVLYYGIIGCLLMISLYGMVFYQIYRRCNFLNKPVANRVFASLLAIYFFLSHVKGDLFMGADMPIKSVFFLLAVLMIGRDGVEVKQELPPVSGLNDSMYETK